MNWYNLKKNKCPKCDKDFIKGMIVTIEEDFIGDALPIKFLSHPCGFRIREIRYQQIVSSQVNRELVEKLADEEAEYI